MRPIYLLSGLLLAATLVSCGPKQEAPPPAPPVVLVAKVATADVPVFKEAIATLDGSTNSQIHSQVTGYLIKQAYLEGSVVQPGNLLFQIDPKPFQADLDKANAALASKQATLKSTQQVLDRYTVLVKSGAISQQEYQNQVQTNLSAQADVDAAQASVETAKINLGYTRITSSIVGVAGHANVQAGDLIIPSVAMTTVSTVDPIQADFNIPEQFYLDNAEKLTRIVSVPLQDRPESIQLIFADGTVYPLKGRFFYFNRQVQASTGAIAAYALFPNPNRILRPGQYARVRAVTDNIADALLIPQRAVVQLQSLNQVMVVRPDNTIEVRSVVLGDPAGSDWIVTSGLKADEQIVVEGLQKCRDGQLVAPQPYVEPAGEVPPPTLPPTNAPPTNPPPAAPSPPS